MYILYLTQFIHYKEKKKEVKGSKRKRGRKKEEKRESIHSCRICMYVECVHVNNHKKNVFILQLDCFIELHTIVINTPLPFFYILYLPCIITIVVLLMIAKISFNHHVLRILAIVEILYSP